MAVLNLFKSRILVSAFVFFPRDEVLSGTLRGVAGRRACLCSTPCRWQAVGKLFALGLSTDSSMASEHLGVMTAEESQRLEFFLRLSMLTHWVGDDNKLSCGMSSVFLGLPFPVPADEGLVVGTQSEARALTGEQGEVMLSGEAGFAGEGLARSVTDFSSTGVVGGGGDRLFLSLWLLFRFLLRLELETAFGEILVWPEDDGVCEGVSGNSGVGVDCLSSSPSLSSPPESNRAASSWSSRK